MNSDEVNYLLKQNQINVNYDIWLGDLKKVAESYDFSMPGYKKSDVVDRFLQIIGDKNFLQYNRDYDQLSKAKVFNLNQLQIDIQNKKIKIPYKYLLQNIIMFLLYSLKYFSSAMMKWVFKNQYQNNQAPINLFYSYGFSEVFKKELIHEKNFVSHGPMAFLNVPNLLFVQANHFGRVKDVVFTRSIFSEIYRFLPLNFKNLFLILSAFSKSFFIYFILLLKNPLFALFHRDLVIQGVIEVFIKNRLLANIIITNTNATEQLMPFRSWELKNFETHIAFYSVNSKAMKYRFLENQEFVEYPYFKHLNVDHAWVWDLDQEEFIKRFNSSIITHIVGPILFYLDRSKVTAKQENKIVTIFDITPFGKDHLKSKVGWGGYNYFCYENISTFVTDIITEVNMLREKGEKIRVQLKPKRPYTNFHHQGYIAMLKKFEEQNELQILSSDSDLFEVISQSDLIISIPFSSPPIIASKLNKIGILYDPTGFVVNNYKLSKGVEFSSGKSELNQLLNKIIHNS